MFVLCGVKLEKNTAYPKLLRNNYLTIWDTNKKAIEKI